MTRPDFRFALAVASISLSLLVTGCESRHRHLEIQDSGGATISGRPVIVKQLSSVSYFFQTLDIPAHQLEANSRALASDALDQLRTTESVEFVGPLTIVIPSLRNASARNPRLQLGFPVNDSVQASAPYQTRRLNPSEVITLRVPQDEKLMERLWIRLYSAAYQLGYMPTDEGRILLTYNDDYSDNVLEMQMVVTKR